MKANANAGRMVRECRERACERSEVAGTAAQSVRRARAALRLIMNYKYGGDGQLNKQMSSSKPRRRNREKKFMDKDEENEVGVMDESTNNYRNKIEEKTEDMFDPHQLKANILKESEKSYQSNFIDFGDQDITEEPLEEKPPQKQEEPPHKEEGRKNPIKKRERAKRGKKMIDSDEDQDIQDVSETKKEEALSELTVEEGVNILKEQESLRREDSLHRQEREAEGEGTSEQEEGRQQETMQGMVNKRNLEAQKSQQRYVFIHDILNKAGFNKAERKAAIYTPLGEGEHSFVFFKRYASGFSEYYQAMGEDQRPILFCQNQRGCIGCNYYISLTKQMDKNNPSYLGKLRGNAAGSVYQLYDQGQQPSNDIDRSKFRVSMAYIEYESNFLGMKGPRKLKAVIPRARELEDFDLYKLTEQESLNTFQPPTVINLRNKQPRWNERLKSYALNFGGRVKQASIKNFILMDDAIESKDEDKAPNLIVFGKIDENTFALEFRHPLNLFQAFGIAMSEFDFKLKCE